MLGWLGRARRGSWEVAEGIGAIWREHKAAQGEFGGWRVDRRAFTEQQRGERSQTSASVARTRGPIWPVQPAIRCLRYLLHAPLGLRVLPFPSVTWIGRFHHETEPSGGNSGPAQGDRGKRSGEGAQAGATSDRAYLEGKLEARWADDAPALSFSVEIALLNLPLHRQNGNSTRQRRDTV